jgi:hypothetical protein
LLNCSLDGSGRRDSDNSNDAGNDILTGLFVVLWSNNANNREANSRNNEQNYIKMNGVAGVWRDWNFFLNIREANKEFNTRSLRAGVHIRNGGGVFSRDDKN